MTRISQWIWWLWALFRAALSRDTVLRCEDNELDTRRHELRRNGQSIPVAPQASELLELLTRRPGVLVTRDQIAKAIWRDDPPANVDVGINMVIGKIRTALHDDAKRPRFVERVPREGYRFITPVLRIEKWSKSVSRPWLAA